MMRSTLRDVATLAGVSLATASLALNDSPKIAPETKERVRQAAAKLNYVPNVRARALARKSTGGIVLVVPNIRNPYFGELAQIIKDFLRPFQYHLILCDTDNDPKQEREYIDFLVQGAADGAIFASSSDLTAVNYHHMTSASEVAPIVLVERTIQGDALPTVDSDRMAGAYQATRFLIEMGHRRIGFIGGYLQERRYQSLRYLGFQQALLEANCPFNPNYVFEGRFTIEGGYAAGKAIAEMKERPTAILASNDLMAIGAISSLTASGLRVPDDISVCGFDNLWASEVYNPPLTTVHVPKVEIGESAAKILVDLLQGKTVEPKRIILPTELVIRKSVAVPPA